MELLKQLSEIQQKLNVPKNQYNSFGGYMEIVKIIGIGIITILCVIIINKALKSVSFILLVQGVFMLRLVIG